MTPKENKRRTNIEMAQSTQIEWTDATWNPVTGCTKIGPGCDNCYAARFAERWRGVEGHQQGFDLKLWPARLAAPERWRKPKRIFVNSMSDLFHKRVPEAFVDQVFEAMERTSRHVYQVLTKRSSRMRGYVRRRYGETGAPGHIWLGVSIENRERAGRLEHLKRTPAAIRFVRAPARPCLSDRPRRHRLGDRRRRKRSGSAADGTRMGARAARSMQRPRNRVLLQAVGRRAPKVGRKKAGRQNLGRISRLETLAGRSFVIEEMPRYCSCDGNSSRIPDAKKKFEQRGISGTRERCRSI